MSKMPHVGYFADGDRPAPNGGPHVAYEAVMILNPSPSEAYLELDLFRIDRPPTKGVARTVATEGVRCVRLDRPDEIGGVVIPARTPYATRLRADSAGRRSVRSPRDSGELCTFERLGLPRGRWDACMAAFCSTHSPERRAHGIEKGERASP